VPAEQALARSRAFLTAMRTRRTGRDFSDRPVPSELVRNAVATAATAPSGANLSPGALWWSPTPNASVACGRCRLSCST
jgi:Nitroreductase family